MKDQLRELSPWLVTFFWGTVIFVAGLYFQRQERKRRHDRGR